MKMKRAIWTILTATVLSSACSIIFHKPVDIKVNAESGVSTPSFTGETELASNDLLFKVSSSTTTESSQRYTLTFLTQFTGYLNPLQQIAVSVDEVRFD